jgi:hypothetical protein
VLSAAEAARAMLAKLPRLHVERVATSPSTARLLLPPGGYVQKSVAGSFFNRPQHADIGFVVVPK